MCDLKEKPFEKKKDISYISLTGSIWSSRGQTSFLLPSLSKRRDTVLQDVEGRDKTDDHATVVNPEHHQIP